MRVSIGDKFGRWKVVNEAEDKKALCQCECGTERLVYIDNLVRGKTKSCGCYRKEYLADIKTNGARDNHKLYQVWNGMKYRCYDKKSKSYKDYGERGIAVCKEWKDDFPGFLKWSLENGYEEGLTIDRIDNDKGYCPDNCRWVNRTVQNRNRRCNHYIEIDGETKTLVEWSLISGLKRQTIQSRIRYGWSGKDLLLPTKGVGANGTTAR